MYTEITVRRNKKRKPRIVYIDCQVLSWYQSQRCKFCVPIGQLHATALADTQHLKSPPKHRAIWWFWRIVTIITTAHVTCTSWLVINIWLVVKKFTDRQIARRTYLLYFLSASDGDPVRPTTCCRPPVFHSSKELEFGVVYPGTGGRSGKFIQVTLNC